MDCAVCKAAGFWIYPAERVVLETGEGVCRGHIVPALLAGYGVGPIEDEESDAAQE